MIWYWSYRHQDWGLYIYIYIEPIKNNQWISGNNHDFHPRITLQISWKFPLIVSIASLAEDQLPPSWMPLAPPSGHWGRASKRRSPWTCFKWRRRVRAPRTMDSGHHRVFQNKCDVFFASIWVKWLYKDVWWRYMEMYGYIYIYVCIYICGNMYPYGPSHPPSAFLLRLSMIGTGRCVGTWPSHWPIESLGEGGRPGSWRLWSACSTRLRFSTCDCDVVLSAMIVPDFWSILCEGVLLPKHLPSGNLT